LFSLFPNSGNSSLELFGDRITHGL
jgi:hypothetical protein